MKIVVAIDSFKGCLTSGEAGEAVADALRDVCPSAEVVVVRVGDGGEGTAETLTVALDGEFIECDAIDPLMRSIRTRYGVVNDPLGDVVLIDAASACGLTLLSVDEREVMKTSSLGLGCLILDAYERGYHRFVIGLGGSATCDGGIGMLSALGVCFIDKEGKLLQPIGASLKEICKIDISAIPSEILSCEFNIICDVENPLYGSVGAAYVFAPQKGASADEVVLLDVGLRNFAKQLKRLKKADYAEYPGAGAAGGLGFAFISLLGGILKSGVDTVLDLIGFDDMIADADLIITGEGKMDKQTICGKLPVGVCERGRMNGVPTVAIAGMVEDEEDLLAAGFAKIIGIMPDGMSVSESMVPEVAKENIKRAVMELSAAGSTERLEVKAPFPQNC